jgi:hypothetical protein
METASGKETIIVLRRLIAYSEKIFQLSRPLQQGGRRVAPLRRQAHIADKGGAQA